MMGSTGQLAFLLFLTIICLPGASSLRAVFDMSGIRGEVKFSQPTKSDNTTITVNLTGLTGNLGWKIHRFPVVYRGNAMNTCKSVYTGGIFDPTKKTSAGNYVNQCNASTTSQMSKACAIGDLSGKHGYLNSNTPRLVDSELPLCGEYSIFGRSLVLYNASEPFACALIDSSDDVITAVATFRGIDSGITGTIRLRQSRSSPSRDTSLDVNLFYANDNTNISYNYSLALSDEKLPEEGVPSYEGGVCPTNFDKERKIQQKVNIPVARHAPSTERFLLNEPKFPLAGGESVIGKTLVLSKDGKPTICASIYELLPLKGEAVFNVDGVEGSFHFKQDSELSPSVVTADIKGLRSMANTYHIHVYRVMDTAVKAHKNMYGMCQSKYVQGHWNPYEVSGTFPSPGTGTVDQYETGDMSGKYGTIGDRDSLSLNRRDYNLPLFGDKSILFRSMVIHFKNSSRWVCSNINPKDPTFHMRAKSTIKGPDCLGEITVEQASFVKSYAASHITTFFMNLWHKNTSHHPTSGHNWHIHQDRVTSDWDNKDRQRCQSPLAHYNPYKVSLKNNYKESCGPLNFLRCELGDTSSKLGKYSIGRGKNRFTESENYFAGRYSSLGRSIVIHAKDSGSARIACASLEPVPSPSFVNKELIYKTKKKPTMHDLIETLSKTLKIKKWQVANVRNTTLSVEDCHKVKFILISSSDHDLKKAFEDLKENKPESLETFIPSTECVPPDSAGNHQAASLGFIFVLSLLMYFI